MKLYITTRTDLALLQKIQTQLAKMGLDFLCEKVETKITQKWLATAENGSLLINDDLSLLANGMKVSSNWQALQKRIVTAGKKTELLLKAAKLQPKMTMIDGTAGFGYDSLILASTGANVTMIEQHPVMFLLLQHEMQKMQANPNWQKLLARLSLYFGNTIEILPNLEKTDVIYLDPMFPSDSYKSAQVSKQMQSLHTLTSPPTLSQETQLLKMAQHQLTPNGRVIVKRPITASFLAEIPPQESWSNDVIRYDGYFSDKAWFNLNSPI